jgi:hypothetical protein
MNQEYTITKRIAKHGSQAIIVIPRILEQNLKPGTIAKITIEILTEDKNFASKNKNEKTTKFAQEGYPLEGEMQNF